MKFSLSLYITLFATVISWSCSKDESCPTCRLSGVYTGKFHDIAACYGCIPFRDTMFTGSFMVSTFDDDSIRIVRSHDLYEWKFAFSASDKYSINSSGPKAEDFTFSTGDSLSYFSYLGGSGGYFKTTFEGKR